MRALFAWCKFMIVFIPVTDLVIVMQINYYYYYYDRQTDGRWRIANVKSRSRSRSLKIQ